MLAKILMKPEEKNIVAKIDLSKNLIGDEGAKIIGEALCSVQSVISLNLCSNSISPAGGAELIKLLVYNYSLIDLNLSSHEGL